MKEAHALENREMSLTKSIDSSFEILVFYPKLSMLAGSGSVGGHCTLRQLSDFIRSNLTQSFPGGLHAGAESFGQLVC